MKKKTQVGTRTVHPAETFAGHHLEIDALIAVLRVDKVREPDCVELFGYHAVEVDERSRHPVPRQFISASVKSQKKVGKRLTCRGNDMRGAGRLRGSHSARALPTS